MKLSVIIPAYNAGDTLGDQLQALADQDWDGEWEVLVADNGSTDNTKQIVESYKDTLPGLRVVDATDKRGAGHARNVGAKESTGDVLLFCDADDVVANGWLTAMAEAMKKYDFVASRLEAEKLSERWTLGARGCPQQHGVQEYKYPKYLPHAATAGLGVKRKVHEAVNGFGETFYKLQDTDYCWRIQLAGTKLNYSADALVHMRFRGSPVQICRQAREWGEYNVRLYKKYQPLGMPKLSWKKGVRTWIVLLRHFPNLFDIEQRAKWLWDFNWLIGRLIGSIRCRVLAI